MEFIVERSKTGIPCLWESGGGRTSTGDAMIIADSMGRPKRAIYIVRKGHRACGAHALIPVEEGDLIVRAERHRDRVDVQVFVITSFVSEGEREYALAEASEDVNMKAPAVQEAIKKASCYHCRKPHYISLESAPVQNEFDLCGRSAIHKEARGAFYASLAEKVSNG